MTGSPTTEVVRIEEILALASRAESERTEFQSFLEALAQELREAWIPAPGGTQRLTLAAYLDLQLESTGSAGDEQSVVDELTRKLLGVLGYKAEDYSYNRPLGGQKRRRDVPDFTVQVEDEELPSIHPLFVVEDKATSVRGFHTPRSKRSRERETPLEQLRRYVFNGAVQGRVGLLCNGFRLEAWQFGGEADVLLVRLELHVLALAALQPGGFPGSQEQALRAFWRRFSRSAFAEAQSMVKRALRVPSLPPAWTARMQAALRQPRPTEDLEREIRAYHEEHWHQWALDVSEHSESLVEAFRGLIELLAADVRHQLDDALARHEDFEQQLKEHDEDADWDRQWKELELSGGLFDLPKEEYNKRCLEPLRSWQRNPLRGQLGEVVEQIIQRLEPHLKASTSQTEVQSDLPGMAVAPATKRNGRENGDHRRQQTVKKFRDSLTRFCKGALERHMEHQELKSFYEASIQTREVFQDWQRRVSSIVLVGASDTELRDEFARQTAYVYLVRLLLVRICEDKGLFQRKLSDGGLALWEERITPYLDYASGRSYDYLTRMAYDCAQNVYAHFYGSAQPFGWYRMDDKALLRALVVLNAFNLERIDRDIIGAVYGRYLKEGKHQQGRYYTPRPVVQHMLDLAGWKNEGAVGRRLCDLACGSGSFLVEACQRLLDRYRGKDGRIPGASLEQALKDVQESLYGIDLNPFACYLAETNLLIQVLELVRSARQEGLVLTVERFHIYCDDSLLVDEWLAESPGDESARLLSKADDVPALIKARAGDFARGFDVLVGNPPYVRADEKAPHYLLYRELIEQQSWFTTSHKKWDLYVPFVEQYARLLSDQPEARCCLVTINSIGSAPYAERLRGLLAQQVTVHDVVFTQGLALFEDASWQDNVIFSFSREPPTASHRLHRRVARQRAEGGALLAEELDHPPQRQLPPERLFNPRQEVQLDESNTVRWEQICYVSKGMVLHSHERLEAGEIIDVPARYAPQLFGEQLVEDLGKRGKRVRHRPFKRDELIADEQDSIHTREYLEQDQVLRGGTGHRRWIEYGEHTRCPARVSRPTFPELYDRPKVMFGTFKGVAVDEGESGQFLVVAHSILLSIRWELLEGVDNRSLADERRALEQQGLYDPQLSRGFSEWYLCALALSEPIAAWLEANKRSMKEHVYPDDIRAIPVKKLPASKQKPFVDLARERHQRWSELLECERAGYRFAPQYRKLNSVPVRHLAERFRQEHPRVKHLVLARAMAKGLFQVEEPFLEQDLRRARASGDTVLVSREVALRVGESLSHKERIAGLLAGYMAELPGTFADRQGEDMLPADEGGLLALADFIDAQREAVSQRLDRIEQINAQIDELAWKLYRPS